MVNDLKTCVAEPHYENSYKDVKSRVGNMVNIVITMCGLRWILD